jgi:hypothetical protein
LAVASICSHSADMNNSLRVPVFIWAYPLSICWHTFRNSFCFWLVLLRQAPCSAPYAFLRVFLSRIIQHNFILRIGPHFTFVNFSWSLPAHTSAILQSVDKAYFVADFDSGGSAYGRRRNANSLTCYYRTSIFMSNCSSEGVDCNMFWIDT